MQKISMFQQPIRPSPEISVVIFTKNRPKELSLCLQSLSKSTFTNFEVIVIDGSDQASFSLLKEQGLSLTDEFSKRFTRFSHIAVPKIGKSKGLNYVLENIHSPLLAFTDDDCISDRYWLHHIVKSFDDNPTVTAVTGKVLPYKPFQHKSYYCPATFENNDPSAHIITKPTNPEEVVGLGSNMAFQRSIFQELGGFKEHLGPGSLGATAYDTEILLRLLIAGKKLFYNPKAVVYRNQWLTFLEIKKQASANIRGEVACYGFLALQGHRFAKEMIKKHFRNCLKIRRQASSLTFLTVASLVSGAIGGLLALAFFFRWQLRKMTNFSISHQAISTEPFEKKYINFSIIIATSNRASLLQQTLSGLRAQKYPNSHWEVIVVNNNPEDDITRRVVSTMQKSMKNLVYLTEKKRGASYARNTGIKKARFQHLIFVDDDIVVRPIFLEGYRNSWLQYPNARILGGRILAELDNNTNFTERQQFLLRKYSWCFAHIFWSNQDKTLKVGEFLFSANMSYRRIGKETVFSTQFGVQFSQNEYFGAEDVELCLRAFLNSEQVILLASGFVEVRHFISAQRFSDEYLSKRYLRAGIETYILEKSLQEKYPNFRSFYMQKIKTLRGVMLLVRDKYERQMLFSYVFNGKNYILT